MVKENYPVFLTCRRHFVAVWKPCLQLSQVRRPQFEFLGVEAPEEWRHHLRRKNLISGTT
jgi:hypothetical protein